MSLSANTSFVLAIRFFLIVVLPWELIKKCTQVIIEKLNVDCSFIHGKFRFWVLDAELWVDVERSKIISIPFKSSINHNEFFKERILVNESSSSCPSGDIFILILDTDIKMISHIKLSEGNIDKQLICISNNLFTMIILSLSVLVIVEVRFKIEYRVNSIIFISISGIVCG